MTDRPPMLLAWTLFLAIVAVYCTLALWWPVGYLYATYENLYGEWTQFFFFVAAAVLFAVRAARRRPRWMAVLLALACIYVAGEEISWGQQVLQWRSPEFFATRNLQGETNLHNFFTGPFATALKDALTYAIAAGLVVYGLLLPWLLKRSDAWRERAVRLGFLVPPLYLWPFFVAASILELGPFGFNEAEVAEVLMGAGLALFALHLVGDAARASDRDRWATRPLAVPVLLLIVGVAAYATTSAMLGAPKTRRAIENRVENGLEKFAGRYARIGRHHVAAQLYEKALERKPDSRATKRSIARAYRAAGEEDKAIEWLTVVLAEDLKRYAANPSSRSTNRSLVRTYRLLGNTGQANQHLAEALRLATAKVTENPDSASAAYSLGRTYELMGQRTGAAGQFARAYALRPANKTYRKAFMRMRRYHDVGD